MTLETLRSSLLLRLLLLAAVVLIAPLAVQAEDEARDLPESSDLPLERVLLFNSGVGYFEHRTQIDGDLRVKLTFDVDDVNDLLKSMVVQDLGGGRISTVSYGSRDPVAKALQSFAVDLTENLTMADLFQQIRGERVYVETPTPITGTIVSIESRTQKVGDDVVTSSVLNLLTDDGLKSLPFDTIRNVRILDASLDQEMRQALQILSRGRDEKKKTVTLEFLGDGVRPVRVGYIAETPVWKTSYRLVLGDDETPFLQGWAIVENTTNRDWEGVDLTLVSGRPISYSMNLYQPLYAKRPVLQPQLPPGVAPQSYDRDMGPAAAMERLTAEMARSEGRGGGRPGAPARRSRQNNGPSSDADSFDPRQGVEAAATGGEVGELFQYVIDAPVHLGRQRSAMIPILNAGVQGTKVSIYDRSVHAKHPLNGLQLENTTGLHIMQGPVTVFDAGAYAGDAVMGDLPPGGKRLLSYAMDLRVEVSPEGRGRPDNLLLVRLVKGTMQTSHKRVREMAYVAKNSDSKERTLLIAHPADASWTLVTPTEPTEKTRDAYRFSVKLAPGQTGVLRVVEEQTVRQQTGLSNLRSDRIAIYLESRVVSDQVKDALRELVRRQAAANDLKRRQQLLATELKAIAKEQDRIRQNMAQIDRTSDLYVRYLTKFGEQETRIDGLRAKITTLQAEQADQKREFDAWLMGLDLQ